MQGVVRIFSANRFISIAVYLELFLVKRLNDVSKFVNKCKDMTSFFSYILQVEKELRDICSDILSVLDKHLIPCSDTGESKVFYYKMKGDYHRYLAEFATANDRKEAAENALVAYKAASDIAMTELATTHPIR